MSTNQEKTAKRYHALLNVRREVAALAQKLKFDDSFDQDKFDNTLRTRLLTELNPAYPLMVAITGGGSTGKSSLFNSIVGDNISAVKSRAGLSRRVLCAFHPRVLEEKNFLANLFESFGTEPRPLQSSRELTSPGPPCYVTCDSLPQNLVLLDTPDFDVGDASGYANRDLAKPVLEACDVFVYIFTNSTYNNKANTEFVRQILTGVGLRRAILVYRCSRRLSENEVTEHTRTVAEHLYGEDFDQHIAGTYRCHEDDRVVDGEILPEVSPLPGSEPLHTLLTSLDPAQTRLTARESALDGIVRHAEQVLSLATANRDEVQLYQHGLLKSIEDASQTALREIPQNRLKDEISAAWHKDQPGLIRLAQRSLSYVSRKVFQERKSDRSQQSDPEENFRQNILEAANDLRLNLTRSELEFIINLDSTAGAEIEALCQKIRHSRNSQPEDPPRLAATAEKKQHLVRTARPTSINADQLPDWKEQSASILQQIPSILPSSPTITAELQENVAEFRASLRRRDRLRINMIPALMLLPATAIVLTAASVAPGLAIVLKFVSPYLGSQTLFIALPALVGLTAAQQKNMQIFLQPIYEIWLQDKLHKIRNLLKEHVADSFMNQTTVLIDESSASIDRLQSALKALKE